MGLQRPDAALLPLGPKAHERNKCSDQQSSQSWQGVPGQDDAVGHGLVQNFRREQGDKNKYASIRYTVSPMSPMSDVLSYVLCASVPGPLCIIRLIIRFVFFNILVWQQGD